MMWFDCASLLVVFSFDTFFVVSAFHIGLGSLSYRSCTDTYFNLCSKLRTFISLFHHSHYFFS